MARFYQRMPKQNRHDFVAAMDIGTTYSSIAFSLICNPTEVFTYKWKSKTPSVLLLNPDQSFRSFGYDAEDDFRDLAADGEEKGYYYFRSFKKLLYDAQGLVSRDILIEDITGKKLRALLVFSLFINCLKKRLIDNINNTSSRDVDNTMLSMTLVLPSKFPQKVRMKTDYLWPKYYYAYSR